jgi:hypothetical protein
MSEYLFVGVTVIVYLFLAYIVIIAPWLQKR